MFLLKKNKILYISDVIVNFYLYKINISISILNVKIPLDGIVEYCLLIVSSYPSNQWIFYFFTILIFFKYFCIDISSIGIYIIIPNGNTFYSKLLDF